MIPVLKFFGGLAVGDIASSVSRKKELVAAGGSLFEQGKGRAFALKKTRCEKPRCSASDYADSDVDYLRSRSLAESIIAIALYLQALISVTFSLPSQK